MSREIGDNIDNNIGEAQQFTPATRVQFSPFKGMWRLWFYDLGCLSFLLTGVGGFLLLPFLVEPEKVEVAGIIISVAVVSISIAIIWQINRLKGTEWSQLVPYYRRNILVQSATVYGVMWLYLVCFINYLGLSEVWPKVISSAAVTIVFLALTLHRSQLFNAAVLVFFAVPFVEYLNPYLTTLLAIASLGYVLLSKSAFEWQGEARVTYLNGMEAGWFWLPSLHHNKLSQKLEQWLFPVNYFMGPALVVVIVLLPFIAIAIGVATMMFDFDFPLQFIIGQIVVITCGIVHWSRVQRTRASESLFMLPCFNGLSGLQQAFYQGQYRLIAVMVTIMLFSSLVDGLLSQNLSWQLTLHIGLSAYWGCGFALGAGSASRTSLHISLAMFIVGVHSGVMSFSFVDFRDGESLLPWLVADVVLVVIAQLLLMFGKRRLWQNGVIDRS
ncbi:ABC transporter permease [Shewanella maritima]|uniref:ABC transporter permease n=1 Tax=Shewanella maritima TaxID=2520507 RepID=A0A411PHY8_9GAMM|nr:ABC transporter permease [Shewanella maritima]QBF83118.1 ABC transporter permease [Shewanella maritima]